MSNFRKSLILLLVTSVMSGCSLFYTKSDKENSELASIIPFSDNGEGHYAMEARYSNWPVPDTLIIYIDGKRHTVTSKGEVISPQGKCLFSLGNEFPLAQLYFAQRDRDIFLFFTDVDDNGASSFVKRVNIDTGQEKWSTETEGFSFSKPLIRGQFAYIGTIGFIGKLKLTNGHFDWKYSSLGDGEPFGLFREIDFPTSYQVRFIAPHPFSQRADTVVVSDVTGEIISMTH